MSAHICDEVSCTYRGRISPKGCGCHKSITQELAEQRSDLLAALRDIAEAEAIPNDAVAFVWCRDVARAAIKTALGEGERS